MINHVTKDNFVVLDIETKESFQAVGAYDASKLSVSVVGLYTANDDQFHCFGEEELPRLWPLLEHADRVVGFNLLGFDYPVLQKYYRGNLNDISTLDILYEFKKIHSFRIKLDTLVKETLGEGKSGDGLLAIRLFQEGRLDELKKYCLDDVRLTRDLFLHGLDKGLVYFQDKGLKREWKVDWAWREKNEPGILTLPF